jgi:malate permease and related proteins
MGEFMTVLGAVLPVFAIALIGLVIRKLNWLTEEADHSLLRVNINVLFPCLVLDAALGNPALSSWGNLLLAPAVGFVTVTAGLLMALWACRFNGLRGSSREGTFAVSVGIYNYGYVPLPLALMLFGNETAGVLFAHNVGVELAMWTLGVMLFTRGAGKDWRKFVNAPLLAILAALLLNATGLHNLVPAAVRTTFHWLGQCAIPMSLILIGAVVADHLAEFHSDWDWRVIVTAVLLRIVVLPALFLLLAKYLPASVELKRVIVLEAAMPAAVFPIVMSRHYGGDPPTALRVVMGTSVVGMITIPIWIRLGMRFAGLGV